MRYWIGVTDNNWFNYLSNANVDEVNFWQPRGKVSFSGLTAGSLYLFKLKKPYNHIAGGGYFVKSTALPLSLAWDFFGQKNGAPNQKTFESMIRKLVADPSVRDPEIGCTVISSPFFWPKELWIPEPAGFAGNIVRGRYYEGGSLAKTPEEGRLYEAVLERLTGTPAQNEIISQQVTEAIPRYGTPASVRPRLGQGAFRTLVTDAYKRKCALTGESTLPVLEAAHILPFSENGPNDVSNGLLLRSDFHKLFDLGMVTITPELRIEISPKIREAWFNGKAYYRLHGQFLPNIPDSISDRPSAEFLRWHNENCFQC